MQGAVGHRGDSTQILQRMELDTLVAKHHDVASLIVLDVRVLDKLLESNTVDREALNQKSIELDVRGDVVEQLRCKSVDLEQLRHIHKASQALAVTHNARSIGRADAMEEHKGSSIGTIQLNDKRLTHRMRRGVIAQGVARDGARLTWDEVFSLVYSALATRLVKRVLLLIQNCLVNCSQTVDWRHIGVTTGQKKRHGEDQQQPY